MRLIKKWDITAEYVPIMRTQFVQMLREYLVRGAEVALFLKAKDGGSPEEVWGILDVVDTHLVFIASCQTPESFEVRIGFIHIDDEWYVDGIDEKYAEVRLIRSEGKEWMRIPFE